MTSHRGPSAPHLTITGAVDGSEMPRAKGRMTCSRSSEQSVTDCQLQVDPPDIRCPYPVTRRPFVVASHGAAMGGLRARAGLAATQLSA